MFDVIERLKAEWTDKYVVIDSPAPELARFARSTGVVKTVNMNGCCLVEFDQFNNIGWYDIDPAYLKIVPKPLPKPAEPKAKPAAKAPAPAKPAAKPAPAGAAKKPSTADILAAARGKAAAPAAAAKPAGKLSTADILAAARGKVAAQAAVSEQPAPTTPEPVAAEPAVPAPVAKPAGGPLPTTTADKIAWCRNHDAKG
jgi:pyruvate/2-oxoglutarate dehydrogenase complex dihydrolipoamide acyltransferase (E2) component